MSNKSKVGQRVNAGRPRIKCTLDTATAAELRALGTDLNGGVVPDMAQLNALLIRAAAIGLAELRKTERAPKAKLAAVKVVDGYVIAPIAGWRGDVPYFRFIIGVNAVLLSPNQVRSQWPELAPYVPKHLMRNEVKQWY